MIGPVLNAAAALLFLAVPWLVSGRLIELLGGKFRGVARPLARFVLAVSLAEALVILAGSFGLLDRRPLLVLLLLVGAALLRGRRRPGREWIDGLAAARAELRARPAAIRVLVPASVLLCLLVGAGLVVQALIHPPLAYDALAYHLVFPAEWVQAQRITHVPIPFFEPANTYFPCNGEALLAWLMLAAGDDRLVNLSQFPFLIAGAAATFGLVRRMGVSRIAALLPAALFFTGPELLRQAAQPLVDIEFAAAYVLALLFLLEFRRTESRAAALLAGLSMGLLVGTKTLGLALGVTLVPVLLLALRARLRHGWRAPLRDLLAFAAGAAPLGSFWYVRNWIGTGNPLFPLEIRLGTMTLFDGAHGVAEMLGATFHVPPVVAAARAVAGLWGPAHPLVDLGAVPLVLPTLMLVVAGSWILAVSRRSDPRGDRTLRLYLYLLPWLMLAGFALINPYNGPFRFLFAAVAVSLLPVGRLLDGRGRWRLLAHGAVALALLDQLLAAFVTPGTLESRVPIGIFGGLVATALLGGWALHVRERRRRARPVGRSPARAAWLRRTAACTAAGVLALLLIAAAPGLRRPWSAYVDGSLRGQRAAAWTAAVERSRSGAVAYTGFNQPYPFYGTALANRVYYVAVDGRQGYRLHDYLAALDRDPGLERRRAVKPAYYRQQPDRDAWLRGLDDLDVNVLVISAVHVWDRDSYGGDDRGFPVEARWVRALPERFERIEANETVEVFRLH